MVEEYTALFSHTKDRDVEILVLRGTRGLRPGCMAEGQDGSRRRRGLQKFPPIHPQLPVNGCVVCHLSFLLSLLGSYSWTNLLSADQDSFTCLFAQPEIFPETELQTVSG